ncbi:MAG: efflux RND transporter periplasmic adaptor subunit [Muribaculaceae bacterium]|nr:efflux RND transporter periplasmic adaptor subunit [Muribaculaceae bacterium]
MKRYISCLAIALAVILMSGCKDKKRSGEEQLRDIDVAEAMVDSVVLHKTYPGYLSSDNAYDVICRADGMIVNQAYTGGSYVKKGQVLFTLDASTYRDAVQQAEATLASAISSRDYAKSHYEAVKRALQAEAVSKMEVLNAESAYHQAEASIKSAQAALHTARTNLSYCTVTSPVSGYITDAIQGANTYVNGSGEPVKLARVYENINFTVEFQIEDLQYEQMAMKSELFKSDLFRAMPLHFRDTLMNQYTADLSYTDPAVNKSTGTIVLKGKVKNIDNELKDGMYVTVSLPYGYDPKAILVKESAISTDQLGKYLYVVNDSNKVVYTPIEVGEIYRDSLRLVTKGIKPGDKYVTKALLTVRNGEKVNPILKK